MKPTYYITTPIYYPSDKLHIGHCYTTVICDILKRYKIQRGYDVCFLTGTDEHGQKIEKISNISGKTPQQYVDDIVVWIKDLWKLMDIDYDLFLRTTDKSHEETVKKIFKKLYDKGDIYKSNYEGLYCVPCETFFTNRQLIDNKCPDCKREVEKIQEENYFFRLSKYQQKLMDYIEINPDFILPISRKNEMINNFLKPGLDDLCVSRTSFSWGIPVEFDEGHVIYVWIDALSNYISALGYLQEDYSNFDKYWPCDLHLMSKEIVRFHTIIWPAILMALDLPLPKKIFSHGWLVFDGKKMGKSTGNVVDPKILINRYGVDSIRYFLARDIVFGQDGTFSNEALILRINSDLANDLGNLVSRTVGMIQKYFEGKLPFDQIYPELTNQISTLSLDIVTKFEDYMDNLKINDAISEIWNFVSRLNKFIDETTPWIIAKDPSKNALLAGCLYTLSESIRIISILIESVMPRTSQKIRQQLNIENIDILTFDSCKKFFLLQKQVVASNIEILFPRLDLKKELEELEEINILSKNNNLCNKIPENCNTINIKDFEKINMVVGEIIDFFDIPKSDKLLKLKVDVGIKILDIVSSIKQILPNPLGKKVVVISNLIPAKIQDNLSEGMILCVTNSDNTISLLSPPQNAQNGAVIS